MQIKGFNSSTLVGQSVSVHHTFKVCLLHSLTLLFLDLDPKEGRRIGLDTQSSNNAIPGSIANSLAEDTCATAIVLCELLFNLVDEESSNNFQQQIKTSAYDLDAWLKSQIENAGSQFSPEDIPALEYLGERRGLWGLLKRMMQPNPMKRKLAVDSLKELKEVLGLRDGTVKWTDDFIVKVAIEEAYLETLIDRFGADETQTPSPDVDLDDLSSSEKSSSDESSYIAQARLADSKGATNVRPQPPPPQQQQQPPNRPKRDVYYDITRSKLTSKYPLSKPSALSSLLPGVKSVSPPATATEIAAQRTQTAQVYDITRVSLGSANPYSNVLPMKNERLMPKGVANLKQDFISNDDYDPVTLGAPAEPTLNSNNSRVPQEKTEEVGRWLLSYLPRLQKQDFQFYTTRLISDGFDSKEMLKALDTADLVFMKKAHERVLSRKLEVERRLDLELDPSSRKRIEMLVGASSKKISPLPSSKAPANASKENEFDAISKLAELEESQDWVRERNQLAEMRKLDVPIQKSASSQYNTLKAGNDLQDSEAWIDEQNLLVEKRLLDRSLSQSDSSIAKNEPASTPSYDIIEAGKELLKIEAWIEEQNKLIEERRLSRSESVLQKDSKSTTPLSEKAPSEYDIIKAGHELEKIKEWINEQNQLVARRHALRSTSGSQVVVSNETIDSNSTKLDHDDILKSLNNSSGIESTEASSVTPQSSNQNESTTDENDRNEWYAEQNRMVEKRRLARIEAERRMKEEG
jgi:hypothetical protein